MDQRSQNQNDREFTLFQADILTKFMKSDENKIEMPPMNSYQRRLLHQLGKKFGFRSGSVGEGKDRHIVFEKSEDSRIPDDLTVRKLSVWNFGDREFLVNPIKHFVEVYLASDGTVGLMDNDPQKHIVATKKVTSGSFKIKSNKIVEIHDEEW